jgi:hypothetical protein
VPSPQGRLRRWTDAAGWPAAQVFDGGAQAVIGAFQAQQGSAFAAVMGTPGETMARLFREQQAAIWRELGPARAVTGILPLEATGFAVGKPPIEMMGIGAVLAEQRTQLLESLEPPGTFRGDLRAFRRDGDVAALWRLASAVADCWHPKDPEVQRALTRRAREPGMGNQRQVLRQAAAVGLVLALGREEQPQRMRFGRDWLKWEDGDPHPTQIRPTELPIVETDGVSYQRWLIKEARRAAEADLTERPYPARGDALDRPSELLPLRDVGVADGVTLVSIGS